MHMGLQTTTPSPSTPNMRDATTIMDGASGNLGQTNGAKVSTTPVPIPKFPGMTPHQAAAKLTQQRDLSLEGGANGGSECGGMGNSSIPVPEEPMPLGTQEFPDVPGGESMEFMEKMMANLRRVGSQP